MPENSANLAAVKNEKKEKRAVSWLRFLSGKDKNIYNIVSRICYQFDSDDSIDE